MIGLEFTDVMIGLKNHSNDRYPDTNANASRK